MMGQLVGSILLLLAVSSMALSEAGRSLLFGLGFCEARSWLTADLHVVFTCSLLLLKYGVRLKRGVSTGAHFFPPRPNGLFEKV